MSQYDDIAKEYTEMVREDPQKRFVQYPEALRLLGDIKGKRILDIGCGSGAFARMMSKRGARVVGYDSSPGQIAETKKVCGGSDIEFIVSRSQQFRAEEKFNRAVSVLVLHYAENVDDLQSFFSSTFNALKPGGKFVCILCNPGFQRCNQNLYNRVFARLGNGKMRVDFIGSDKTVKCSAEYSDFLRSDYEQAALNGGFKKFKWKKIKVDPNSVKEMGENYWDGFEEDCPYVGLIAYK